MKHYKLLKDWFCNPFVKILAGAIIEVNIESNTVADPTLFEEIEGNPNPKF